MSIRFLTLITSVAFLAMAGCPQVGQTPAGLSGIAQDAPYDGSPLATDAENDDETERQRRALAWLESDLDQDGLTNGIELEFGLDPNDPTDGPDIDGDGVPNFEDDDVDGDGFINETDPDIDGDYVPNDRDDDVDGDAIPDEIDFDIDADGIRNRWDLDIDSDGDEDAEALEVPDALAEEYLHRAQKALAGDDDDDEDDDEDDSADRFEGHIEQLIKRAAKGDSKAVEEYNRFLRQINSGGKRPIKPLSWEARTIAEKIAERFESQGLDKFEVEMMLHELVFTKEFSLDQDATDALDVLFRQATTIEDPDDTDALREFDTRIEGVVKLKETFDYADLSTCSDAISRFAQLPGEDTSSEKIEAAGRLTKLFEQESVNMMAYETERLAKLPGDGTFGARADAVTLLAEAVSDPDWNTLVEGVEWLAEEMDTWALGKEWSWDAVRDALKTAPSLENGVDWDVISHVIDEVLDL